MNVKFALLKVKAKAKAWRTQIQDMLKIQT